MGKRYVIPLLAALLAVLFFATLASADVIEQFAVGIRAKGWDMTGNKNFTGSITSDTVSEKQELYPSNFHMLALFCPYGGVSLEWDRFAAVMEQDGKLIWDTFTLGLNARLPVDSFALRFAPYAMVGVTFNQPQFSEENWWRYGWNGKKAFDDFMSHLSPPYDMSTGRVRNFSTDSSFGWAYGAGVDIFLTKNLALNLDVRWNKASTNVRYTIVSDDGMDTLLRRDFTYDLDTVSYGVGLRWYF
jgi:opacity protein-like surface antigen